MYVKLGSFLVLCILFSKSVSGSRNFGNISFTKDGSSFVRTTEPSVPILSDTDYVYNASKALERLEMGESVTGDELNTFREGLIRYYLSRIYDYEYQEEKERVANSIQYLSETRCLPNVKVAMPTLTSTSEQSSTMAPTLTANSTWSSDSTLIPAAAPTPTSTLTTISALTPTATPTQQDNMFFHHVKVYGFPSFKKNIGNNSDIVYNKLDADPYLRNYTGTFKAKSDVVIFTGKFDISDKKYVFVYETTGNKYSSEHLRVRNVDDRFKSKKIKDRFDVDDERLIHSYDSTLDDFGRVNDSLYPALVKTMKQIYLPRLAILTEPRIRSKFEEIESTSFGELYRKKLFDLLMKSAVSYLNLTIVNMISIGIYCGFPPLIFKDAVVTSRKPATEIVFENISVTGLLNYTNYELSKSGVRNENSTIKFDDFVLVKYAETGENGAYINFSSQEGQHEKRRIDRKYRIESITFRVVHVVPDKPKKFTNLLKLLENGGMIYKNDFYIMVNFQLKDFNDYYQFVVNHIAQNMIASIFAVISS